MTPRWIDERDARTLHDRLLVLHGGRAGLRDGASLAPALARPRQHLAYSGAVSLVEPAAIHTAGIVQSHPFVDGSKRTGFVVGILFPELNEHRFTAGEDAAAQAVIALAAGMMDEAGYTAFLAAHSVTQVASPVASP